MDGLMKDGFQWCPFIELNPIIISMILHDQGRSGLQQVSSRRFSKQGTIPVLLSVGGCKHTLWVRKRVLRIGIVLMLSQIRFSIGCQSRSGSGKSQQCQFTLFYLFRRRHK
jgi:hypothetical protein